MNSDRINTRTESLYALQTNQPPTSPMPQALVDQPHNSMSTGLANPLGKRVLEQLASSRVVITNNDIVANRHRPKAREQHPRHEPGRKRARSSLGPKFDSPGSSTSLHPAKRSHQRKATSPRRREQPLRALKPMLSIEGRDLRLYSPAFGEQDFETDWLPLEGATSREMSFGSSFETSNGSRSQSDASNSADWRSKTRRHSSTSRFSSLESHTNASSAPPTEPKAHGAAKHTEQNESFVDKESFSLSPDVGPLEVGLRKYVPIGLHRSQAKQEERHGSREIKNQDVYLPTARAIDSKSLKRRDTGMNNLGFHMEEGSLDTAKKQKRRTRPELGVAYFGRAERPQSRANASASGLNTAGSLEILPRSSNSTLQNGSALSSRKLIKTESALRSDTKEDTEHSKPSDKIRGFGSQGSTHSHDAHLPLLQRRQIELPPEKCRCYRLHWYFTIRGLKYPRIDHFPGSRDEFLNHVWQLAHCGAHKPKLIDSCWFILRSENLDDWVLAFPCQFLCGC